MDVVIADSEDSDSREFSHDNNGNTISDLSPERQLEMIVNARNRLTEIWKDGEKLGAYQYNALGQRVSKTSVTRGRLHAQFDEGNQDATPASDSASNGNAEGNDKGSDKGKGNGQIDKQISASDDNLHGHYDNKKITERFHFHYDQSGNLIAESDEQGNVIREYIYIGNYRLAIAATTIEQGSAQPNKKHPLELYFIHNDHLGTPNKITDAKQRIVWSMEQTPFGEVDLTTEAIQMPMRFPGQYADLESGLSYNYFRDYDASIGRYVQSDPIGLGGGLNTYGYGPDNPLSYMDFFGREVRIRARYVAFGKLGELAAHTATVIEVTGFSAYTYASFNENNLNVVKLNPPTDHGKTALPMTVEVVIPPPEGMTQLQWDLMVLQSAEHVLSSPIQKYELYPDSYQAEGNCHTTTRRIIEGAGGFIPQDFDPPGEDPDLHPETGR